jgi:hypothetical protein
MNDGTDTLRARLNKHAAEIAAMENRYHIELAASKASVRYWKGLAIAVAILLLLACATGLYIKFSAPPPSNWRADSAPALQRVYVVTEGFVDKKGQWRNLTNGERIEVKHWMP